MLHDTQSCIAGVPLPIPEVEGSAIVVRASPPNSPVTTPVWVPCATAIPLAPALKNDSDSVKNVEPTGSIHVPAGEPDLPALAEQLVKLRKAMKDLPDAPEQDIALGSVAAAEKSAREGQASSTLEHLKAAGPWALDTAQKIGVDIAAAAIKSSMGLS